MRLSNFLVPLLAVAANAAPTYPKLEVKSFANPVNAMNDISTYFNAIASKVQSAKSLPAPQCDLSKAQMPLNGLPPPSAGLSVRHVAIGRGTQNYTCQVGNDTAAPKAIGALATLFNISCVAALYPDIVQIMPAMAVNFDIQDTSEALGPAALPASGVHYFRDLTTPFFNLDTPTMNIGTAPCAKNSSAIAPPNAAKGQTGDLAVPWLKLTAEQGATGNIKEVYRVDTAGGSAPATCKGMPAEFQVQYSAIYWFWAS